MALTKCGRLRLLCLVHLLHLDLLPLAAQRWRLRRRGICCFCWHHHSQLVPGPLHLVLLCDLQQGRQEGLDSQVPPQDVPGSSAGSAPRISGDFPAKRHVEQLGHHDGRQAHYGKHPNSSSLNVRFVSHDVLDDHFPNILCTYTLRRRRHGDRATLLARHQYCPSRNMKGAIQMDISGTGRCRGIFSY